MSKERTDLTNEAIKIDGSYIEDLIPGYVTLKTSGRESLPLEYESYAVGSSDGEKVKRTRYPARTITVEFLLRASDITEMRTRLNHLNNILSRDEADFVFNDEADKFFVGIPIMKDEYEKGRGWVSGQWQVYCADPFKYSTAVFTAEPVSMNDHSAEFEINYSGSYPSKPILRAEFAGAKSGGDFSEDGDCGYVAFIDEDENVIQLGNPDAVDIDAYTFADQLINRQFSTVADWLQSGGKVYGDKAVTGSASSGNITDANWNKGKGQTISFAKAAYGSAAGWHGPILWKSTEGAVNFSLNIVHRLCVNKAAETGTFECGIYNQTGSTFRMIAGIVIEKTASGTNGTVKYIVGDVVIGSAAIDLSYYNTNFGYCKKTAVYKTQYYNKKKKKWQNKKIKKAKTRQVVSGYNYTQSNLNTTISKADGVFTFKVGNLAEKKYTDTDLKNTPVHNVSFHFGQNGSAASMHTNAVNTVKLIRNPSGNFCDIPNVFTSGDVVEADCYDATVYLKNANTEEGHYAPEYGALGNDWEDFQLTKGINNISVVWSDWVNTEYKPELSILYNEVFV